MEDADMAAEILLLRAENKMLRDTLKLIADGEGRIFEAAALARLILDAVPPQ